MRPAGKIKHSADPTSRHPSPSGENNLIDLTPLSICDEVEPVYAAAIQLDTEDFTSISWECIADKTQKDPAMCVLMHTVETGFLDFHRSMPQITPF